MSSKNLLAVKGCVIFGCVLVSSIVCYKLRSRLSENTEFERETSLPKEMYLYRLLSPVVDHLRQFSQVCSFSSRAISVLVLSLYDSLSLYSI